jgi:LPS-assembly lipoprotein
MIDLIKFSVILLCSFFLTGCGFHLRGSQMLAPRLKVLYLEAANPYDSLVNSLRRSLQSMDVVLVPHPALAPYTLQVVNLNFTKTLTNISSSTLVRTFTLTETLVFQIKDRRGLVVYGPQTVAVSTAYTTSDTQLLGDNAVLLVLRQQMQRDLLFQMLMRLSTTNARHALQQSL